MAILKDRKKRESISTNLPLPTSATQKERYRRIQNELDARNIDSLHELTRERIDLLLDEVENELDINVRIGDAC